MSKKIDWMSEPSETGSIGLSVFTSSAAWSTPPGDFPGLSFEKLVKNGTERSSGFGSGVPGLSLIHCATSSVCASRQVVTQAAFGGSALTQFAASVECVAAHWA